MAAAPNRGGGQMDLFDREMDLRGGHWKSADVAREMLRNIPDRAMQIITNGDFAGTDLVRVSSEVHRPSFKEWGGIILTDTWLYLNDLLDQKLFVKPNLSKEFQAGQEADRCKKLMGALRYLYRNSVRRAAALQRAERIEAAEFEAIMPSDSDGEAAHDPGLVADHAGGGDLVPRDSDREATLVLPGRGSDQEEGGEEDCESSGDEGEKAGSDKEDSDDAMEEGQESEMEVSEPDVDVPEGPSGSNGVKDVGPVCERFGPGKMCDGRGCHPCMNALLHNRIYKTPDSKSRPFEKDMSEEKKPMPADPEEASDVTWL
eukprot:s2974_g17.t1